LSRRSREEQVRIEAEDAQDFAAYLTAKLREYRDLEES
jgi:hypothetical protein